MKKSRQAAMDRQIKVTKSRLEQKAREGERTQTCAVSKSFYYQTQRLYRVKSTLPNAETTLYLLLSKAGTALLS